MNALWREENLFREALVASVVLHFLLFRTGDLSFRWAQKHEVEIDITNMAPRSVSGSARKAASAPPAPKPVEKPKEWTKPTANQKVEPLAAPTKPAVPTPEEPPAEIPIGTGEGGELKVSHLPQLLNLSDLSAILQRFYPQKAREDGRQATVVMDLHLSKEGQILAVDVVKSADPDFDDAAVHVAKLLRFNPAYVNGQPVAVKMRQAIQFKLGR